MRAILLEILDFFKLSLHPQSGISSKRLTLFVCVFTLISAAFINLFFQKKLHSELLYCLEGIITLCLGGMVLDKKIKRDNDGYNK